MSSEKAGTAEVAEEGATKKSAKKSSSKKVAKVSEPVAAPKAYAVIRTGGKQYRVSAGDRIAVAKMAVEPGSSISFEDVLATCSEGGDLKILSGSGKTLGVKVTAKVIGNKKDKKVLIFKKRLKTRYQKKQGHRQELTEVVIDSVSA